MKLENLNGGGQPIIVEQEQAPAAPPPAESSERARVEIALLTARIAHLELVVETARSLMNSNQERLLRRLHEVPREITELSAQLRRLEQ